MFLPITDCESYGGETGTSTKCRGTARAADGCSAGIAGAVTPKRQKLTPRLILLQLSDVGWLILFPCLFGGLSCRQGRRIDVLNIRSIVAWRRATHASSTAPGGSLPHQDSELLLRRRKISVEAMSSVETISLDARFSDEGSLRFFLPPPAQETPSWGGCTRCPHSNRGCVIPPTLADRWK